MDTPDRTDVLLPITDIQDAVALDFDYEHKKFYFTDVKLDVIRSVSFHFIFDDDKLLRAGRTTLAAVPSCVWRISLSIA